MERRFEPVLAEIIDALEGIAAATAGKTLDDFRSDWLLRRGGERGIEIISEASRHLPDDLLKLAPEIPWKQVGASETFFATNTTRRPTRSSGLW